MALALQRFDSHSSLQTHHYLLFAIQNAASRSISQNIAVPPIAYGGSNRSQARDCGRNGDKRTRRSVQRPSAINANTAAIKLKWPTSTPILNSSSASGMCPSGNPTSLNPPANPKPCNNPNENATSHG